MPRGNPENLVLNSDLTPEERKARASRAGKASGEARKRRKEIKECLDELLTMSFDAKGDFRKFADENGKITGVEMMAVKAFLEGTEGGNSKYWELARDTAGEKPADKLVVSEVTPETIAEIDELIKEVKE